jgi:hypothetical protein
MATEEEQIIEEVEQDRKSQLTETPMIQINKLPKIPERKDEPVHPRAQQKLDDLRRRGFIQ